MSKPVRILGCRFLARNYELPEQTDGGLWIPDAYRNMHDGQLYEVVAAGEKLREKLCVVADLGETLVVGLSDDVEGQPLDLMPDDIVKMRGLFRGTYSPEMTAYYGYRVWFVEAIEIVEGRAVCAIKTVWPSRNWKDAEKVA